MRETVLTYLDIEFSPPLTESRLGKLALALIRDYVVIHRIDKSSVRIELTPGADGRAIRVLLKMGCEVVVG